MTPYVLLTEFFPPKFGGIEDTLGYHARWLATQVTVVTPVPADPQQPRPYPRLERSLFSSRIRPRWWWLVPWLWQRRKELTLVMFGHYSSAVFAAWLLRPFGFPYALFVHGDDLLRQLQRPGLKYFVAWHLRQARWVSVNSTFMAERVHQLGVARARIFRSHPVIAETSIVPRTIPTAQPHQLITVCRLVVRKNVSAMIEIVAALKGQFPDIHYHIVGHGPERATLEQQVSRLGISQYVTFHGQVQPARKWELLRQASVFVMLPQPAQGPYEIEGLGLSYLEASAAGLPVVAADHGGVRDAVLDQRTGLLVDPQDIKAVTDRIAHLLLNPDEAQRLGQAGQSFVRQEYTEPIRGPRFLTMVEGPAVEHPPLVSVIIPAYRDAATIEATLDSVLAQTWPKMEIIVVNDGSTDALEKVIAPYRDRIRYVAQENQGAPAARNRGAQEASGQFLLFVDADVILQPQAVSRMVQTLVAHPEASYAYSKHRYAFKNFPAWEFSAERLRQLNYIHTTSLIRREHFPGFDPSLQRLQDWDVWLTMLAQGHHGIWIPEYLYLVQQDRAGMSQWVPSFVYRLPWIGQGAGNKNIQRFRQAETIIRRKHGLI